MKKILSFMVAAAMALSLTPSAALAAETEFSSEMLRELGALEFSAPNPGNTGIADQPVGNYWAGWTTDQSHANVNYKYYSGYGDYVVQFYKGGKSTTLSSSQSFFPNAQEYAGLGILKTPAGGYGAAGDFTLLDFDFKVGGSGNCYNDYYFRDVNGKLILAVRFDINDVYAATSKDDVTRLGPLLSKEQTVRQPFSLGFWNNDGGHTVFLEHGGEKVFTKTLDGSLKGFGSIDVVIGRYNSDYTHTAISGLKIYSGLIGEITPELALKFLKVPYNIDEKYSLPDEILGYRINWTEGAGDAYKTITAEIDGKTKDFYIMTINDNDNYVAAYTTDGDEAMGKSLHLAVKTSEGWQILNFGLGVLFPRADLNDGSIAGSTRILEEPWLYRKEDGNIGLAAKVRKLGGADAKELTLWETADLVHFTEIGAAQTAPGYENASRVSVDAINGSVTGILPITEEEADYLLKKLGEVKNISVEPIRVTAKVGQDVRLPGLTANYSDGSTETIPVDWNADDLKKLEGAGVGAYTVRGVADVRDYASPMIYGVADPVVYKYKDKYYFIGTNESGGQVDLYIRQADTILGLTGAMPVMIFQHTQSGDHSGCNWAPELHEIGGELYCLFASSVTGGWDAVQCRIMKCSGDPMDPGAWGKPEKVVRADGSPLIPTGITLDMTYFEANGRHYYAWAHRPFTQNAAGKEGNSMIAIAEIDPSDPYKLKSEPVIIRTPDFGWDRNTAPVDEGPNVLKHGGKLYMTFSGSGVGTTYCLGMMTADEDADLLKPESWEVTGYPVQASEHFVNELGPGHNSFVKDELGRDTIIYHMMPGGGTRSMTARTIHYAFDGTPLFYMTADRYLKPELRGVTATVIVSDGKADETLLLMEADADGLSFPDPNEITADLALETTGKLSGAKISWKSSSPSAITDEGRVIRGGEDKKVTMTAELVLDGHRVTRSFELTVLAKEAPAAYLFAYFTGNSPTEERLFYGVSRDGYNFRALNGGGSVLTSDLGTGCIRDPFIFKGEDGYYYIVATDMRSSLGWSSNFATVVFKTPDLINIVDRAYIDYRGFPSSKDCTRAWAPQVIWCPEKKAYMIYLAMEIPSDPYATVMYRQYATDLCDPKTYTDVELMLDEPFGGAAAIDGDIIYDKFHNEYIMFYDGKRVATTKTLSGQWSYSDAILPMTTSSGVNMDVEGSNIWQIIGEDKWVIAADGTAFNGGCYALVETTDFEHYTQIWDTNGDYSFDFTPRHGYVIPISERELNKLFKKYGEVAFPENDGPVRLSVDAGEKGVDIAEDMYGIFFEDINYAADGGIYSEVIQNRSFEAAHCNPDKGERYAKIPGQGWTAVNASASYRLEAPLNENNPTYLSLTAQAGGGIKNNCYSGFAVHDGESFNASIFARGDYSGEITVSITDGSRVLGSVSFKGFGKDFEKHSGVINTTGVSNSATVKLTLSKAGSVDLDMISVMSRDTFNGRENGLRKDIVQKLADMHPGFVRFPGGCVVEGYDLENRYSWKDSVGPVESRKENWNRWQTGANAYDYCQTLGLGFYEYFLLCEDIGAKPMPVLNAGLSCQFQGNEVSDWDSLYSVYIQDALDLIEFANGDPETGKWAKLRADMGHPEPFGLEYLGIGNEQRNSDKTRFYERFEAFEKEIHKLYPAIKLIPSADSAQLSATVDWLKGHNDSKDFAYSVDEHYYGDVNWFLNNVNKYDGYDRDSFPEFVGEYAVTDSNGGTLYAALAEAAFMTGMEKNADVVNLAAYAPLLAKEGYVQWTPDLVWFNNSTVYGTPSYYVQSMFANNSGSYTVKNKIETEKRPTRVGAGTWNTAAKFKNITVTDNLTGEKTELDLTGGIGGNWIASDGIISQTDASYAGAFSTAQVLSDSYTLELQALKTSGSEGFLIPFNFVDVNNCLFWNIGGWNNTETAIQRVAGGNKTNISPSVKQRIETNVWYNIKIETDGRVARCYLNGELIHTQAITLDQGPIYSSASRDDETGDIILKLVNTAETALDVEIGIENAPNINPKADVYVLTGDSKSSANSAASPKKAAAEKRSVDYASNSFAYTADALSFTVIRLHTGDTFAVSSKPVEAESLDKLPETVPVIMSDGGTKELPVEWRVPKAGAFAYGGSYAVEGKIKGTNLYTSANVTVKDKYLVRIDGGKAIFSATGQAKAIVAAYGADGLLSAVTRDFTGSLELDLPSDASVVKAFIWDMDMRPLAEAAKK